ncbi:MAG: magnesium transporter [Deltaproteobacteria bacterium RBG_13_43_22]|nr:MAG: magnesium transporter [Deltaproteobacteria bacterium RBG_13_43_22]
MNERGYQLLQETIERLLRRNAYLHLNKVLKKTHPADIAHLLTLLNERSARNVFEHLPEKEIAANVLSELEPVFRSGFLQELEVNRLVEILSVMADDDTADLLADLPEERRQEILGLLSAEHTEDVSELLAYPEGTAGRIMTTDFLVLPKTLSAQNAIQEVRKAAEKEMVFYLYVTDEEGRLSGVLSLRQLVTAPDYTPLEKIMTQDVVKVNVTTDQEEVARMVSRYNLLAIPVVDHSNLLVGIITVDDVIDVIREEAAEDMLKMAGTSGEEINYYSSVWKNAKARLPWLFASWIGGIIAMNVIGAFSSGFSNRIAVFAILATFIPVVNGMGGNVGTQSLSIIVRGLATGRVDSKSIWREIFRESRVGLLLGVTYGILLALAGIVFTREGYVGVVAGIAMCVNMILASVLGTFLPLIAAKFKIDPAVASGPFIATSIDVVGATIFFLIAYVLLV